MKFRSDDKRINQYMLHANEIEIFEDGKIVEFKRGRDCGYAIFENDKVIEIFVRNEREFKEFKDNRNNDEILAELKEDWLMTKF